MILHTTTLSCGALVKSEQSVVCTERMQVVFLVIRPSLKHGSEVIAHARKTILNGRPIYRYPNGI
jgi:hypothetical protein